jgi:2-haloacid dehalogenase
VPIEVVVFDVNETLSDMAPLADRFTEVGAPGHLAPLWFAALLRDAFALTAAGSTDRFATFAADGLRAAFHGVDLDRPVDDAVRHVLDGFQGLAVHPDVPEGVRALRAAGLRLATLSNGGVEVAEGLLGRAGVRDEFERILSVEQAGVWKPAPGSYAYAARECGVDPARMLLVAVHPWDVDGAQRAGLAGCWLDRTGAPYPSHCLPPTHTAAALPELAARLRE